MWCKSCRTPIIRNRKDSYLYQFQSNEVIAVLMEKQAQEEDYEFTYEESMDNCPLCEERLVYHSTDIRPVFMPERIMISTFTNKDYLFEPIWSSGRSGYYVDGKRLDLTIKDLYMSKDFKRKADEIRKKVEDNKEVVDFTRFITANQEHLQMIEESAFSFIKQVSAFYKNYIPVVSFSGGKDSTVVSDLVVRSLKDIETLHVFGDTTLEFPYTYEYIERFKGRSQRPPFLGVDTAEINFFDLVDTLGPPSRVMNWCCTIFKTGPIGNLFRSIVETEKILTYYGIRRTESNNRRDYKPITESPKISNQLVVSPILTWYDADIWLYILARNIDFNWAYQLGFTRVGCWCCPNNSAWSEFLCRLFMEKEATKWRTKLVKFAKKIGKPDAEVYIDEGYWKRRQGGRGLDTSTHLLSREPCALEEDAISYTLSRPLSNSLYELFKPFGKVKNSGSKLLKEVFIMDIRKEEPLFSLQGNSGNSELKVRFFQKKNKLLLQKRIECQLRKYQSCIKCSACVNICPSGAITLVGDYTIDEDLCTQCKKCIAHYHKGCLVTKSMMDY